MCLAESSSPGAMLRTGFWKAPRRQEQSVEDKYLLLFLLTCPQRSCIGLYPIHVGEAAAQTGWDKQQFFNVLDRLVGQKEIAIDGYWVLMLNWWDHNSKPGPGFDETIARLLSEAPQSLKKAWQKIAQEAGKSRHSSKELNPKKRGVEDKKEFKAKADGTRGTTPGTTPGSTPGYNNSNNKGNYKGKDNHHNSHEESMPVLGTTYRGSTKSNNPNLGGSGESPMDYNHVVFPEGLEKDYRPAFELTCRKLKVSTIEATQLGHELCARIARGNANPEHRIVSIAKWLEGVVENSRRSGQPILSAGIENANKVEIDLARKEKEKNLVIQAQNEKEAELQRNEKAAVLIANAGEDELRVIADLAVSFLLPMHAKFKAAIRESVLKRILPIGISGMYVNRAVDELGSMSKAGQ